MEFQNSTSYLEIYSIDGAVQGCLAIRLEGVRCPKEYMIARMTTYGKEASKFREASYVQESLTLWRTYI